MKRKSILLAVFLLLMSVSVAQALPQYTVADTPGRSGSGGPFLVNDSFQTFCVEIGENISLGGKYWGSIDSAIWYNASGNILVSGAINANTAKLYNYFLDKQSTLTDAQKYDIQLAIWMWQDQMIDDLGNYYFTNASTLNASNRTIMALNLWNADVSGPYSNNQNAFDNKAQTLLIAVTPEPGTLLLIGLGLVGLAVLRRKE
jgi:hypothetical protein